jgi:phage baseplate assembly protein W
MAIRIKQLEQVANTYTKKGYFYKDLFLDISRTKITSPGFNVPIPGEDIRASFDLGAINNSLTNLFNTLPGQRFLFPEYGLNLYQYLFEPITSFNARSIGERILQCITTYEPRINVLNVNVQMDVDNSQYKITIVFKIPILDETAQSDFLFDVKKQSLILIPVI